MFSELFKKGLVKSVPKLRESGGIKEFLGGSRMMLIEIPGSPRFPLAFDIS